MNLNRQGLSLIEVLVASIVMVALVLPLLMVFSGTIRTTEVSIQEVWAQHLATELMEQVKVMPFAVGYEWLFERPFPNPPPQYPNFLSLAPTGDMPCAGFALPTDLDWALSSQEELPTANWTVTGAPITLDTGSPPDPNIAERSRIFLSPLPKGFRRYLQIYRPIRSLAPLANETNLMKVVVKVEWPSARTANRKHMRHIELRGLLSNPRVW